MKKSVLIGAGALALAIAPHVAQAAPVDNAVGAANGLDALVGADDLPIPTPDPDPNIEGGQDLPQPEAPESPEEGGEEPTPAPAEDQPEAPATPEPTPTPEPAPAPTPTPQPAPAPAPEPNPGADQPSEDPGTNQLVPLVPAAQPEVPAEEAPPSHDISPDLIGDVPWDLNVEEANEVYEDGVSRSQLPSAPITPTTSVTETQRDITLAETGGTFAFFLAGSTFLLVGGSGAVMASRAIRRSKPHT